MVVYINGTLEKQSSRVIVLKGPSEPEKSLADIFIQYAQGNRENEYPLHKNTKTIVLQFLEFTYDNTSGQKISNITY